MQKTFKNFTLFFSLVFLLSCSNSSNSDNITINSDFFSNTIWFCSSIHETLVFSDNNTLTLFGEKFNYNVQVSSDSYTVNISNSSNKYKFLVNLKDIETGVLDPVNLVFQRIQDKTNTTDNVENTSKDDKTENSNTKDKKKTRSHSYPEINDFSVILGGTYCYDNETKLYPDSTAFKPGKQVEIVDLYVCKHEVTQGEYEKYCKYHALTPSSTYGVGENYPVYCVNWYDAIVYCNLRSIAENLTPCYSVNGETNPANWSGVTSDSSLKYCGPSKINNAIDALYYDTTANGYRLPTEAEWEYIAREENTASYIYSGSDYLDEIAWFYDNSLLKCHEVMQKKPNALGVYDMSGNIMELCFDAKGEYSSRTVGETEWYSSFYHYVAGGGYTWRHGGCTVTNRVSIGPDYYNNEFGFRVVRNAK